MIINCFYNIQGYQETNTIPLLPNLVILVIASIRFLYPEVGQMSQTSF